MSHLDNYLAAVKAGDEAERKAKPGTFYVAEHEHPLDDTSPIKRLYTNGGQGYEAEGTAIVKVRGTSSFGRWIKTAKLTNHCRDHVSGNRWTVPLYVRKSDYYGGIVFSTPVRGYERNIAWASGFVQKLNELDPKADATYLSFMD